MFKDINKFIRNLSKIYDPDSNDTFVSLYFKKNSDKKFIDRRVHACQMILNGDHLKNFNLTMDNITHSLKKINYENIAVFASYKQNFLEYINLDVNIDNLLIVDSSPYIRPLAKIIDEWESFTLILIDSNSARIYSISLGEIDNVKKLSSEIMNKHKKGGMSQARFNRLRKGSINNFLTEVIDALKKRVEKQIIIAGPGLTKKKFYEMLPKILFDKVVDLIDININNEKELLKESFYIISRKEKRESYEAVKQLKQEILKEGLAVYGVKETLNAVKNGQVELLIIEKNYKLNGWICENCQIVEEGKKRLCPYCSKKTSEVDVLEEIIEFAERTDANIEFTDEKEIADLGHVGAILRYK